jgi:hypothetical protein
MVVVSILSASALSGYLFRTLKLFPSLLLGAASIGLTVLAASRGLLERPVVQIGVIAAALTLIAGFMAINRKATRAALAA